MPNILKPRSPRSRAILSKTFNVLKWLYLLCVVGGFLFITPVIFAEVLPPVRSASINILSVVLALAGTLYLAYDLLGGIKGPLKWATLVITYAFIGIVAVEHILFVIALGSVYRGPHSFDPAIAHGAFMVLAIGAFMGIFGGILVALRQFANASTWQKLWSVFVAAVAGAVMIFLTLVSLRNIDDSPFADHTEYFWVTIIGAFLFAGFAQALQIIAYQGKSKKLSPLSKQPSRRFSWPSSLMGLGIAVLFSISFAYNADGEINAFGYYTLTFLPAAFFAAGFSRTIFWQVGTLSKNTLAFVGLGLICMGTLLQLWTPVLEITRYAYMPQLHQDVRNGALQFNIIGHQDCKFPPTVPEGKFYCIHLNVKNISKKTALFKDSDQALVSDVGREFWADSNKQLYANKKLEATPSFALKPRETRETWMVFDIPKDQLPEVILLHDSSDDSKTDGVRIQLKGETGVTYWIDSN